PVPALVMGPQPRSAEPWKVPVTWSWPASAGSKPCDRKAAMPFVNTTLAGRALLQRHAPQAPSLARNGPLGSIPQPKSYGADSPPPTSTRPAPSAARSTFVALRRGQTWTGDGRQADATHWSLPAPSYFARPSLT